ncbi:MAG: hypothetical protein ACR2PR_08955, partial [Pseudohongiellaceae bacterium]
MIETSHPDIPPPPQMKCANCHRRGDEYAVEECRACECGVCRECESGGICPECRNPHRQINESKTLHTFAGIGEGILFLATLAATILLASALVYWR